MAALRVLYVCAVISSVSLFQNMAAAQSSSAVGTIGGTFDVTLSGSATYTIPIKVAPGASATQPKISLTYDSQSSSGSLGAGWSISGLSAITRGPKSKFFDGFSDGIRLEDSDALYLDGQRLVAVAVTGTGGSRVVEYRKEIDDQTQILQSGADLSTSRFVARTKGGLTIVFNGEGSSTIRFADGTMLLQAASYIFDTTGNFIRFSYLTDSNGDYDISRIEYTGRGRFDNFGNVSVQREGFAAIDFQYETAPRSADLYVGGKLISKKRRLKGVRSSVSDDPNTAKTDWTQVTRYAFDYEERPASANRFVLTQIRQFGEDESELLPTKFSYSTSDIGWANESYQLPAGVAFAHRQALAGAYRFARFAEQNAGVPDLLVSAQINGQLEAFAFQNKGGGVWDKVDGFKPPFPFTNSEGSDLGVLLLDVNDDGRIDLIQSHKTKEGQLQRSAYIAEKDRWAPTDQPSLDYRLPFNVSVEGKRVAKILTGVFDAGRKLDLLYESEGQLGFLENTSNGWVSSSQLTPPVSLSRFARLFDVDCDGKPELLAIDKQVDDSLSWKVFRFSPTGWSEETRPDFIPPVPASIDPGAILEVRLHGSSCMGLVVSSAHSSFRIALRASAIGWETVSSKTPPFDLVTSAGGSVDVHVVDANQDAHDDVIANHRLADGSEIRFAYLQTDDGWIKSISFEPPLLSSDVEHALSLNAFIGDLDGDAFSDIVLPGGTEQGLGRVFAGSNAGFVEKPDFGPRIPFARGDQQDRGVRILDLNGDGLPDIVYNREVADSEQQAASRGAFVNTGRGWLPAPGLTPPVPYASDNITGNPVQFVDVDGDGFLDMLYSFRKANNTVVKGYYRNVACDPANASDLTICGPDTATWDPRFNRKWMLQEKSPGVPSDHAPPDGYPFAAERSGDLGVRIADLDSDGRADILVGLLPPKGSAGGNEPVENCRTENGKEVCELNRSLFKVAAFVNNGSSWVRAPQFDPPLPFVSYGPEGDDRTRDLMVQVVDVSGDRLPDIVAGFKHPYDETLDVFETWINTNQGWRLDSAYKLPNLPTGGKFYLDEPLRDKRALAQWADVNGDGSNDIVFSKRMGSSNQSTTFVSTGRGFINSGQAWKIPTDAIADRDGDPSFRLIDVSADGLLDILYVRGTAAGQKEGGLLLNTGSDWLAVDKQLVNSLPAFIDANGLDQGVRLFDVDGNGLLDVLQSYASGPANTIPETPVLLNTGRRSDVLAAIDAGFGLATTICYQTLLEVFPKDGGACSGVAAAPWNAVYVPGPLSSHPIISPVPAMYVVRRAVVDEGDSRQQAFSYRYGEFRMHGPAMRSLGFGWRESFNEVVESQVLTRTELLQDIKYRNSPIREATCWVPIEKLPIPPRRTSFARPSDHSWDNLCPATLSDGLKDLRKLTETRTEWALKEATVGGAGGLPSRLLRQISLSKTKTTTFELDGGVVALQTDSYTYDDDPDILKRRQNVIETRSEMGDGSSIRTTNEYGQDDPTKWLFGRLTRSTVVKVGDTINQASTERHSETRVAEFGYDRTTGLLAFEVANAHSPRHSLRTTYSRDQFGNVVAAEVSALRRHPRVTRFQFDELGRFSIKEINALGHSQHKTVKSTTGSVLSATGANGLTTKYEYDGFGRLRKEVSASGITVTTDLLLPNELDDPTMAVGVSAAYAVRSRTEDLPPTIQLFDSRGRAIRAISEGFTLDPAQRRPIYQDTSFDILGRVTATSLPYEPGSTPSWARVVYDRLGRPLQSIAPDGATTTRSYSSEPGGGSKVVVTDPRQRKTTTVLNMRRLPIAVSDAKGGIIEYQHDAGDRLLRLVGPMGAVTEHRYDDVGQRRETVDPDLGLWKYSFDAFGKLIEQIDAKGQITTLEYDDLGRLVRQAQDDSTSWWDYDTAQNGMGSLASVRGSDGYREDFFYDELGRQIRSSVTIQSETFSTSIGYDHLGRIEKIHYPSLVTIKNSYDQKGFLSSVSNADSGNAYWTAIDYDLFGRTTVELLGNKLSTRRAFDALTGRPTRILVGELKAGTVLDLNLEYDLVGNLTSRVERVGLQVGRTISEKFEYDDLDRLIGMSRADRTRERYSFDAAGRMTFKSGVGDYTYAAPISPAVAGEEPSVKPFHAVLQTKIGSTRDTFGYDRNGNMVRGPTGTFEYTAANQMKLMFANQSRWARFDYAPTGARYRQFARTGIEAVETLYLGSYERVSEFVGPLTDARRGKLTRHRINLSNSEGIFATLETNGEYSDVLSAMTGARANQPKSEVPRSLIETTKVWYLHKDQLGSVIKISDEEGRVAAGFWYDPWGKRTAVIRDTKTGRPGQQLNNSWNRGFTGHEHMDRFSLIHMNGRVYNASTALFTSSDPLDLAIGATQGLGRYRYVQGNPLRYTDPTGLFDLGGAIVGGVIGFVTGGPGGAIAGFVLGGVDESRKFIEENWKTGVIIGAAIAVTVVTGGAGSGIAYAILAGAAGGATAGALGAALYGGSFDDVMAAGIKGAVVGAFSGAIGYGIASIGMQGFSGYVGQGVASGIRSQMSGEEFGRGFWIGFASAIIASGGDRFDVNKTSVAYKATVGALTGGVASRLSGGKFENGAVTGAFAAIFTHYARQSLLKDGRPLNEREKQLIRNSKIGTSVDTDKVRIVEGSPHPFQPTRPMSPNGNVYMGEDYCGDFSDIQACGVSRRATFVHEMTHVMQYQGGQEVALRGLALGVVDQVPGIDVYTYAKGTPFENLNLEQQGKFNECAYYQSQGYHGYQCPR